jgi:hypothetical protein
MDRDPGGPKTCGSGGSESATLVLWYWFLWLCVPGQVVEEAPILIEVGDKPKLGDDSLVLVVGRNEAENILMPAIYICL